VGSHATAAFTALGNDRDRSNDTTRGTVEVQHPERHDVGATAILAPAGVLDSGTVVTPLAVVRNFGTRTETFPVTFTIGTVETAMRVPGPGGTAAARFAETYRQTVQATLAMGETDTLAFPDWVADPLGRLTTLAFTDLAGDDDRSNDTVFGADTIEVQHPERHDVGATAILAPAGVLDSGTVVTPLAVVRNFGTRTETFPVTFTIGGGYSETVQATLGMGGVDTVSFPSWTAQPVGSHATAAFTALGNDRDRSNDTTRGTVEVQHPERHDVGATLVIAPAGTVFAGTVVTPRAAVRNFGTRDESFPVTFAIGAYQQTVQATLAMGETDTLAFPDWTATPAGDLTAACWTGLAADENRANDTTRSQVRVELLSDVGTEAVLAPVGGRTLGEGIVRTIVAPVARIANYGQRTERSFTVRFCIDSLRVRPDTVALRRVAEQFVTVSELAPGAELELTFDNVELGFGSYAIRCSTMLDLDQHTANDEGRQGFRVSSSAASDRDGRFKAVVYTRAGERVRAVEQDILAGDPLLVRWDGKNDRGEVAAPGIYICLLRFDAVDGEVETQTTKLLVTSDFGGMVLTWR
jgi:hypothetical protein